MTLGKGLGGGVPLSALLAKKHCSCFEMGDQGGTYCGNPLVCAAGVAVMHNLLAEGFLENIRVKGEELASGLRAISKDFGLGEVRGAGMLLALELRGNDGAQVVKLAREAGFLLNAPRPHLLRFMPALNTSSAEIAEGIAILRQVIRTVTQ